MVKQSFIFGVFAPKNVARDLCVRAYKIEEKYSVFRMGNSFLVHLYDRVCLWC